MKREQYVQVCCIKYVLHCDEDQMFFLPCWMSQEFAVEGKETGMATGNR